LRNGSRNGNLGPNMIEIPVGDRSGTGRESAMQSDDSSKASSDGTLQNAADEGTSGSKGWWPFGGQKT